MTEMTVLNPIHRALGAKMVDFGGWDMPISYGSQIEEHHAVRRDAGMFDVSHMTVVDLRGARVREFLRHLLANSVDKLKVSGKALYTCMLNPEGGVIDDLIVYFLEDNYFRLVVNAATRDKDLAWIRQHATRFGVQVEHHPELAMIAVQGPNARAKAASLWPADLAARALDLKPFSATRAGALFIARTGYTGEDGFEITLPSGDAAALWRGLQDAGVRPCGLGARDTLRLEAGMNLYGQDMDEHCTPYEAGLAWTVSLDEGRDFIGRAVLERQRRDGVPRQMIGLVLDDKGVLRHGQHVHTAQGAGEILSGTFAPTLGKAVAFARVPAGDPGAVSVEIRERQLRARAVKYPFVRNGQACAGI